MSYPGAPGGYPPYPPQGPGMFPPPNQATVPLSYPQYPGAAAPYPGNPGYPTGNPGYPPSNPGYPPGYPSNPGYPPMNPGYPPQGPMSMPQPGYPGSSPYPPAGAPAPYPQSAPGYGQPPQQPGYGSIPPVHGYQQSQRADYSQCYSAPPSQQAPAQAPKASPTLRPHHAFDPRADAEGLRKAMKGFGTDEKAIIQILTRRTNTQRQEIAAQYKALYGKVNSSSESSSEKSASSDSQDLIKDLKGELSGNLENVVVALMTPTSIFLANELNHAMSGLGTNEETLIEILTSSTNSELRNIKVAYEQTYGKPLESDIKSDTSGNFERLLVSLCQGRRDENPYADPNSAERDAQALLRAGELRLGTDESTFNAILCTRSFAQLKQIFNDFQRISGHEFERSIKNEFSGSIEEGLLAIVEAVKDRPMYFARALHQCLARMGTNDRRLVRILSTRCEIDLGDIKDAYHRQYGKTLEGDITGDTSGDYKKALLSLICG